MPSKKRVMSKMPKKLPRMQMLLKKRRSLKKLKNKLKPEKRNKHNKLKNSETMLRLSLITLMRRKKQEISSSVATDLTGKERQRR